MDSKKLLNSTLVASLLGGIFILYYFFNPSDYSLFLICPFKYATGYHCPGCGSQRAIHQLAHGNILDAFGFNPLMVLSIPLVLYGFGVKAWNYLNSTNHRFKLFYNNFFIYTYFIIVLLFWILRNIPIAPFNYLSPSI
ncbi:MAG: hypothetical protein ACI840_000013 [Ulvibacter sp.]|jgi:hypothetical protein